MSAQGGTLGRLGTVHVPIWPVAALVAVGIAATIALSVAMRDQGQVAGVSDTAAWDAQAEAYVDSLESAAVISSTNEAVWNAQAGAYVGSLESAAVIPSTNEAVWNAQAEAYVDSLEAMAVPTTATAAWDAQADAYVDSLIATADGGPKAAPYRPIEVNGKICGQCR